MRTHRYRLLIWNFHENHCVKPYEISLNLLTFLNMLSNLLNYYILTARHKRDHVRGLEKMRPGVLMDTSHGQRVIAHDHDYIAWSSNVVVQTCISSTILARSRTFRIRFLPDNQCTSKGRRCAVSAQVVRCYNFISWQYDEAWLHGCLSAVGSGA